GSHASTRKRSYPPPGALDHPTRQPRTTPEQPTGATAPTLRPPATTATGGSVAHHASETPVSRHHAAARSASSTADRTHSNDPSPYAHQRRTPQDTSGAPTPTATATATSPQPPTPSPVAHAKPYSTRTEHAHGH